MDATLKEDVMDAILLEALKIVKIQAGTRAMTVEEISTMIATLSKSLRALMNNLELSGTSNVAAQDPKKAIKEKSITCLVCGKSFKVLTKKHFAAHELTSEQYREKYGYAKDTPLLCKALQRERRKKGQ